MEDGPLEGQLLSITGRRLVVPVADATEFATIDTYDGRSFDVPVGMHEHVYEIGSPLDVEGEETWTMYDTTDCQEPTCRHRQRRFDAADISWGPPEVDFMADTIRMTLHTEPVE